MLASGLQILTKRQDIRTLGGEILHRGQDFFLLLAKPQHQPGLRRNFRMRLLRTAQQLERALVHRAFADLPIEPRHGFRVVVENVRAHDKDRV